MVAPKIDDLLITIQISFDNIVKNNVSKVPFPCYFLHDY